MFSRLGQAIEGQDFTLRSQRILRDRLRDNVGKISSGIQLRSAADGPGLVVASDFLRSRVRSLEQASENVQNAANFLQVAEGALSEVTGLLIRLRELSIRAANLPGDEGIDRALQDEADEILGAIERLGETTRSGRTRLFSGEFQRTVVVNPLSSTPGVGVVGASVPDFSSLSLGFHQLSVRGAGGRVTGVDTTTLLGLGEEGRVTDAAPVGSPTAVIGMNADTVVFTTAGGLFAQNFRGLDSTIVSLNPGGRTNLTDIRIGPDNNSVVFEADFGANRGIFQVDFATQTETQRAGGTDDRDLDVTVGVNRLAFTSPILPYPVTPSVDDVDALAFNRTTSRTMVVDNDGFGGGGGPVVQEFTSGGTPVAAPVAIGGFFPPGASITGMAYSGVGNDYFVLDGTSRTIRRLTIAGGAVAPVGGPIVLPPPPGTVGGGTVTSFTGSNGGFDSFTETAAPTIVGSPPVPETLTLTFIEDPDGAGGVPIMYTVSGSESGAILGPTPFVGGAPIVVNGVSFTLSLPARGVSRGGVGGVTTLPTGPPVANDTRVRVQVDGGATPVLNLLPNVTGAAIAADLTLQQPLQTTVFDPVGSRYILQSNSVGGASAVAVTDAPPAGTNAADDLRLGVANGGLEANGIGLDVLTGDTYSFAITSTGVTTPTGLAFDGTNFFVGDAATGIILEFNAAGVQQTGGIDFGSLGGIGNIARLAYDPVAANGDNTSFYVLDDTGNVVEIDDNSAPGSILPVLRNVFAQAAPRELGISADGAGNLFIGQDIGVNAGGSVRQVPNTGLGAGAAVFVQDLGTLAITQISIGGLDPELSKGGTRVAYVAGGDVQTRDVGGGTLAVGGTAGVLSIDDVSATGRYVAFRNGGGGAIIDMTVGAASIVATGNNQKFSPTSDPFVFYEAGGEIFRRDISTGIVRQLTGAGAFGGPLPGGSADFAISPDGSRIAYTDAGGDLRVINSDGTSATTVDLTVAPSPNPTGGAQASFSPSSGELTFLGDDGQAWVRGANDVNTPVLNPLGAFVPGFGPSVAVVNTVVQETFTITVTTDNDGADIFSVTGSVSGAHAPATAGVAYTSGGALGAGLQFTIQPSGQYAVGTTFTIDTDFLFGVSLDGGPETIGAAGTSEVVFSPTGETLEVEFGSIRPATTVTQAILVQPGGEVQARTEILEDDDVPFHIDELSVGTLRLVPFDLSNGAPRVLTTELRSGTLLLTDGPRIVDGDVPIADQRIKVEFTSTTTFQVTGSDSGVLLQDQTFVPGAPITVGNVTFTLAGAATIGDELVVEMGSNTALVDQALDQINRLRSQLGSKVQELDGLGRANAEQILELTETVSTIRDVDYGKEVADLTRNEVLSSAAVGVQAQANSIRETILGLMSDNIQASELFGGG